MYGTNINICNLHYYSIQLHAKMLKLLDSVLEHSSGTPLHLLLVTDRQQNNHVHHLTQGNNHLTQGKRVQCG